MFWYQGVRLLLVWIIATGQVLSLLGRTMHQESFYKMFAGNTNGSLIWAPHTAACRQMIKDLKIKPAGGGKANPKGKGNGKKPKATAKAKNGPKRNPKGDSTKGGSKKGNDNKKGSPSPVRLPCQRKPHLLRLSQSARGGQRRHKHPQFWTGLVLTISTMPSKLLYNHDIVSFDQRKYIRTALFCLHVGVFVGHFHAQIR